MDRNRDLPWQDVARRVKGRMLEREVRTGDDLSQLSGVHRSSLSLMMTGKRAWRLEHLQAVAAALHTTVSYLIGESDDPEPQVDSQAGSVTPPHPELHRRLAFLGASEAGRALQDPPGASDIFEVAELEAIAITHDVPVKYLTDFGDPESADRVEALVEFSRATQESGVQRIATRSLGALSAAELRALTRVIKRG